MSLTVAPHHATTRHLASCYLFQAERRFEIGPVLGLDVRSSSVFCFDPFSAYAAGLITNPEPPRPRRGGKRQVDRRQTPLLDGVRAARALRRDLGPEGRVRATRRAARPRTRPTRAGRHGRVSTCSTATVIEGDAAGTRRRHAEIVGALADSGLGRALRADERAGLEVAIEDRSDTPSLQSVVDALLRAERVDRSDALRPTSANSRARCRELAYELRRLVDGDLAGMFDGTSTVDLRHADGRGVHVDLSPVYTNPARARPDDGRCRLMADRARSHCPDVSTCSYSTRPGRCSPIRASVAGCARR